MSVALQHQELIEVLAAGNEAALIDAIDRHIHTHLKPPVGR